MATPTSLPASFSAGAVLTAAQMNNLRGAFRVLQVVQTVKTDTWSQSNSGGGDFDVTGLSVSITPSATSSKVLVMASVSKGTYGSPVIKRGSTTIVQGDAAGSRTVVPMSGISVSESNSPLTISYTYLDSPNTTSATTYKVSMRDNHAPIATTMYINRGNTDNNEIYSYRATCTLTVMEISA